jgi:hypothetical protein
MVKPNLLCWNIVIYLGDCWWVINGSGVLIDWQMANIDLPK